MELRSIEGVNPYQKSESMRLRPITPSTKCSINGRLRASISRKSSEKTLRQRHQLQMLRSRLAACKHLQSPIKQQQQQQLQQQLQLQLQLQQQRPSTTPNNKHSSPIQHLHECRPNTSPTRSTISPSYQRSTKPQGRWRLQQRLTPLPGFSKKNRSTSTTSTTSTTPTFIHIKSRYTRWMKNIRHMAATRPGYAAAADDRAMCLEPERKDAVLICSQPRAGQSLEMHLHIQARRIQQYFKLYMHKLKNWAAELIQQSYRMHRSKTILLQLKIQKQRHNHLIRRMKLRRSSTRLLGWRKETVRQIDIRMVGKRFFHSGNTAQLRWCLDQWQDFYYEICDKNNHTIECFHKYKRHKLKCQSFYLWQGWSWLQRELRNFVKKRIYKRWKKNVTEIVMARTFGIESSAASKIQRCYRKMRERDLELMQEMECEGDVVAFKEHRKRVAVQVQCRARIGFAHKAVDARRCARYICSLLLLTMEKKCEMHDTYRNVLHLKKLEEIRLLDEKDFILCFVREEYEKMPNTFARFGRWPRKCWVRTVVGKNACQRKKKELENQMKHDQKYSPECLLDGEQGKEVVQKQFALTRSVIEALRLRVTEQCARNAFRIRWPEEV